MKNFLTIVFAIMLGVFLTRACSCTKDFSPIEKTGFRMIAYPTGYEYCVSEYELPVCNKYVLQEIADVAGKNGSLWLAFYIIENPKYPAYRDNQIILKVGTLIDTFRDVPPELYIYKAGRSV